MAVLLAGRFAVVLRHASIVTRNASDNNLELVVEVDVNKANQGERRADVSPWRVTLLLHQHRDKIRFGFGEHVLGDVAVSLIAPAFAPRILDDEEVAGVADDQHRVAPMTAAGSFGGVEESVAPYVGESRTGIDGDVHGAAGAQDLANIVQRDGMG